MLISPSDTLGLLDKETEQTGFDQWLIGDQFLQNYYSIFDYENKQIGFIESNTDMKLISQYETEDKLLEKQEKIKNAAKVANKL